MLKIEAVVVIYNPDEYILDNISSYIDFVDKLYIVDNSEIKNVDIINKIKRLSSKCVYIDNNGNQGIGQALNIGAKFAIKNKANWLLTMDQDSKFEDNDLKIMLNWIKSNNIENIGIVSPMHSENEQATHKFYETITMTSGNILNLSILDKLDFFNEKLFIDSVDTEYCLRLKQQGFLIKRIYDVILNHNLGDIQIYKFLGFSVKSSNHNAMRRYYMTRNRLYIYKEYYDIHPQFLKSDMRRAFIQFIKIILVEKDKLSKVKYTIKGIRDYYRGKFGK